MTRKPAGKRAGAARKSRRLALSKETLKDLSPKAPAGIRGGLADAFPDSRCRTCSCRAPC